MTFPTMTYTREMPPKGPSQIADGSQEGRRMMAGETPHKFSFEMNGVTIQAQHVVGVPSGERVSVGGVSVPVLPGIPVEADDGVLYRAVSDHPLQPGQMWAASKVGGLQ